MRPILVGVHLWERLAAVRQTKLHIDDDVGGLKARVRIRRGEDVMEAQGAVKTINARFNETLNRGDAAAVRRTGGKPGEFLFAGRSGADRSLSTRQYARRDVDRRYWR